MTEEEFRVFLRKTVETSGMTQEAYAAQVGVSNTFLNDVMQGRRLPGRKLLAALKKRRVVKRNVSYEDE
jgi:transcriptional regulator with XRE-family HTH domain